MSRGRPAIHTPGGAPAGKAAHLVECGTRALLTAAFGPEQEGELAYTRRLLHALDDSMLLLADCAFDAGRFLAGIRERGAQFLVRSSARRVPTPSSAWPTAPTSPASATASCPNC
ncbi:hypothetical protein ACO0M4_28260 [Streptomyces sp. RGM 3693]|uniref:hypothetical protein n=1 Tax=Streptomyces sp. RGM 3693 TaxID=3413284 RepID=UPI003D2E2FD1